MRRHQGFINAIASTGRMVLASLFLWLGLTLSHPCAAQPIFQFAWGVLGTGNGQFLANTGICKSSFNGFVYVADQGNHRIQVFDSSGAFINKWGSLGSGNGQFEYPTDVVTDAQGFVYVVDSSNARIQKFTPTGTYVSSFGSAGTGDGQFIFPMRAVTDSTHIYVVDGNIYRISKFTLSGVFAGTWPLHGSGCTDEYGTHNPYAEGIVVTDGGELVVSTYADCSEHIPIQRFSKNGDFRGGFGQIGQSPSMVSDAGALGIDHATEEYYLVQYNYNRVEVFNKLGAHQYTWTGGGAPFNGTCGVWVERFGTIYLNQCHGGKVQVWSVPVSGALEGKRTSLRGPLVTLENSRPDGENLRLLIRIPRLFFSSLGSHATGRARAALYDVLGRKLGDTFESVLQEGDNHLVLPSAIRRAQLRSGQYFLRISVLEWGSGPLYTTTLKFQVTK